MPGCQGRKLIGTKCQKKTSGIDYEKEIAALLVAREAQEKRYCYYKPVDPNPPSPLKVAGVGIVSTTTMSAQGIKSAGTS